MAEPVKGLRLKPTYEDLISVAKMYIPNLHKSDGLQHVKFPYRDASFLRNGFMLSQFDGEGMRVMEQQQQMHIKEKRKDLLKQAASTKRVDISKLRHPSVA